VNAINTVLIKVLAREFYREHAVLFLVTFGLAFGFMSKVEHLAIAEFFISQPLLTLIPVALWAVYTARIITFNTHILRQDENGFLYNLVFITHFPRLAALAVTSIIQLLPALLYGIVLTAIAAQHHQPLVVLVLLVSMPMLIAAATLGLNYKLHHPNRQHRVSGLQRYLNRTFVKPQPLYFIGWLVRQRALLLFWSKIISCLLLFAVLKLYTTDDYDLRLLGLGTLFAFGLSIELAGELHRFNNLHFALLRQLPLSQLNRITNFLVTWLILILPETGLLITRFPASFGILGYLSVYSFALSIPFLFYNLFYMKDRAQEDIMKIVYGLGIGWFILILFNIPLAILAITNIIAGIVLWKRYWYTFEYLAHNTKKTEA